MTFTCCIVSKLASGGQGAEAAATDAVLLQCPQGRPKLSQARTKKIFHIFVEVLIGAAAATAAAAAAGAAVIAVEAIAIAVETICVPAITATADLAQPVFVAATAATADVVEPIFAAAIEVATAPCSSNYC